MDTKLLGLGSTLETAFQVLKLQVELHDGHSIRANRTVEEQVTLLKRALESQSTPVMHALTRLISLMTDKQIVFFEVLGVNFDPLRIWARAQHTEKRRVTSILSRSSRA